MILTRVDDNGDTEEGATVTVKGNNTLAELAEALLSRIKEAIGEVLGNAAGEGRRLRTLAIVSAPPEGSAEDEEGGR